MNNLEITPQIADLSQRGAVIANEMSMLGYEEWILGKIASRKLADKQEAKIFQLERENSALREKLEASCRDWAVDDTAIRELAKRHGIDVDGTTEAVPPLVSLVEQMSEKLAEAEKMREKALSTRPPAVVPSHVPFSSITIGNRFEFQDALWTKLDDETAIADGYEASNGIHTGALVIALDRPAVVPMEVAEKLAEALQFYANPETYFAIGFLCDPPNGDFMEDFSDTQLGEKPGKKARIALAEYEAARKQQEKQP
jgi:hypothetical protein